MKFSKNEITLFNFEICKKKLKYDFHFFISFFFLNLLFRLNEIKLRFFILFEKVDFTSFLVFFVLVKFLKINRDALL